MPGRRALAADLAAGRAISASIRLASTWRTPTISRSCSVAIISRSRPT